MTPERAAASEQVDALVVGAGPAGLMATETLMDAGLSVLVAEHKPSPARKFLMAGKSGLNLTKEDPPERFLAAYGDAAGWLAPMIEAFGPAEVRAWAEGLGETLFTGSTGRVFPTAMKASPLLRAWLARLAPDLRRRWRWTGFDGAACRFETPDGPRLVTARVTVLALGGASWRRLGSDGAWAGPLADAGVPLAGFAPSNAGLSVDWTPHMARWFGHPLKAIALQAGDRSGRGEVVVAATGLQGGGLYPLTPALRAGAGLVLDLRPDLSETEVAARLGKPRGKASLSTHLRKTLALTGVKAAILREFGGPVTEPRQLAALVKALPVRHAGLRPMDEAISTAGGVRRAAVDDGLMLDARPGTFVAGEMLDWEAPTGGYLLTACLATGRWAGRQAAAHAQSRAAAR